MNTVKTDLTHHVRLASMQPILRFSSHCGAGGRGEESISIMTVDITLVQPPDLQIRYQRQSHA